jgi:putative hydrolase of the HAD superfamily
VSSELKTLLFDLDGTLYVSALLGVEIRRSSCRYIADLKGVSVEAAELLIRKTQNRLSAASGCDTSLSLACQELGGELPELHRHFAAELSPGPFLTRDERVVELLKTLGRRFELYIYTNNNRVLTASIMNSLGIAGLFRQLFTIEDFWIAKPDRGTLAAILNRIGRLPQECLFVGDRYDIDLRLPAEMGCAVFLVSNTEELFALCKLMNEENI